MAYDDHLAERTRMALHKKAIKFDEKKMMGGLTFMVDDKMCLGIVKNDLMARIDPAIHEQALARQGCREMDFTGRPMKGFVFVAQHGIKNDEDLMYWISLALDFNPRAKSSSKKTKK